MSRVILNRVMYGGLLAFFFAAAWMYGGRLLYAAFYSFTLLPVLSYAVTFLMLRGLRVTQTCETPRLMKDEPGRYEVYIHNRTPLMLNRIQCRFIDDHFAVAAERGFETIFARPFTTETHVINFRVKYRGFFRLGLQSLKINDMLGLFTITRKLNSTVPLTVWPKITEVSRLPLMSNLFSQAASSADIREEDYSVVSDVRKYEPTDPLKRVHWKLTAKKNEWMVKNFQTNALNKVTVITDTFKPSSVYEDALELEDRMVENALGVMRHCLKMGMPVEWAARMDVRREAANLSQFDALYHMAAELNFDGNRESAAALPLLNKCINETAGYINAAVFAFKLSAAFCERALEARRMGHSVAVVYLPSVNKEDAESLDVFNRLRESGVPCLGVTP